MYILSVNISHDPSVCLLKDGQVVYYVEDERITGVKTSDVYEDVIENFYNTDSVNPFFNHIDSIKKYTNNVDYIIFSSYGRHDLRNDRIIIKSITKKIQESNIQFNTLLFFEDNHHVYHAANAFYASGFDNAAALVMDGGGAYDPEYRKEHTSQYCKYPFREVETIYNCSYDFPSFKPKYQHFSMLDDVEDEDRMFWKRSSNEIYSRTRSCGDLFAILCNTLNMDESRGTAAGKVMGLSGHRLSSDNLRYNFNILHNYETDKLFQNNWFEEYNGEWITIKDLGEHINNYFSENNINTSLSEDTFDFYLCASVAYKLQQETFKQTCRLIKKAIDITGKNKIVLSGGYFMNCVNNYKYTKEFPEVEFFVDPMPHDAGTAIGAAKYLWYGLTKSREKFHFEHVYFGP